MAAKRHSSSREGFFGGGADGGFSFFGGDFFGGGDGDGNGDGDNQRDGDGDEDPMDAGVGLDASI
jgi:hypothetical protein